MTQKLREMRTLNTYANFIPYLYFLAITGYWFTIVNRDEGITAYPILLFAVPLIWQLLRPNKKLNFILGICFVCLSSYLIIAYLSNLLNITSFELIQGFLIYGGILLILNFFMSAWIMRNSYKHNF